MDDQSPGGLTLTRGMWIGLRADVVIGHENYKISKS